MKYVLLYDTADDVLDTAPLHYDEHVEFMQPFRDAGSALFTTPLDDPRHGAISVWTTREAAEEFVAGDPFVRHGVVTAWHVVVWPD